MYKIKAAHTTLVFILCLCLGCEQSKETKEKVIEPKCISSQSDCLIKTASGNISVLFNREPVITETPFDISLVARSEYKITSISAHMEGKNMFMGKVPLFFEPTSTNEPQVLTTPNESAVDQQSSAFSNQYFVADTLLGSCSEENMRWIIYFKLSLENESNETFNENFTVEFDSLRR